MHARDAAVPTRFGLEREEWLLFAIHVFPGTVSICTPETRSNSRFSGFTVKLKAVNGKRVNNNATALLNTHKKIISTVASKWEHNIVKITYIAEGFNKADGVKFAKD